jgi:sporulation protein YlmC with PRC-barrel domain
MSRSDLTPAFVQEDVLGRKVIDISGQYVGIVCDLMIDDNERRVRLLEIEGNGSEPWTQARHLVPVEAVVGVKDDMIRLDREQDELPSYAQEDADEIAHDYLERIFTDYGYIPYWHVGAHEAIHHPFDLRKSR